MLKVLYFNLIDVLFDFPWRTMLKTQLKKLPAYNKHPFQVLKFEYPSKFNAFNIKNVFL